MDSQLIDRFGRKIEYLRLSVTDRCDLRCSYCLPEDYQDFVEPESWLTFLEIERLVVIFAELGLKRLRITGGEPLVRKNIVHLIERISQSSGIKDISLSTNGTRLTHLANDLKKSGVKRINVSLDSLNHDIYQKITKGKLSKTLAGLQAAKAAGFDPIKINVVVLKDLNDAGIEEILSFCLQEKFILRLIETMPIGETGRNAAGHYLSLDNLKKRLEAFYRLTPYVSEQIGGGPARYFLIEDFLGRQTKLGFITPISQHFCATCNRVRLSTEGVLYFCLGQENAIDLKTLIREKGLSNQKIAKKIKEAIFYHKPEKHDFVSDPKKIIRFMSYTGG